MSTISKYDKTEVSYLLRWEEPSVAWPGTHPNRELFQNCDSLEQAERLLACAKPGVVNARIIRRTITEEAI